MIIANVRVNLSSAETLSCASIPKNAVGLKVRFQYADPLWNKLSKTAVFRNGTKTLNSILTDDCAIIPHELLCKTKDSIYVGLYGTDANQSLAIPTVWAKLGEVSSSATPSSSATSEATLPHWAQIQEKVEFLEREMMIQEDLNRALEQAKESGTFDGPQGPKGAQGDRGEVGPAGYTPVAGVDYWTSKDKQAISTEAANIAASAIQHSSDIICTATGSSICLDEASNRELHGLKLYGKTTQNGTPTPDVPVPLESVGANGSVDVTVCGKNLVDSTNLSWRTTLPTNSDSQSLDCKLSAGKYVFSIKTNIGTARSNTLSATLIDTNNQNIMQINRGSSNSINGTSAFFLTKEDAERVAKLNLYYNYSGDSSPTVGEYITELQIECGTTATDYEPYKEAQILTASTPNGLPGIPVSTGGNYTDENGQQWICDEIDFARGKYVQRVFLETIQFQAQDLGNGIRYVGTATNNISPNHLGSVVCKTLPYHRDATVGLNGIRSAISTERNIIAYYNGEVIESAELLYPLASPIETDLTAEEMAQYAALHTHYPNTTICNDEHTDMEVKYITDTKMYIDKKFSELATAILNV